MRTCSILVVGVLAVLTGCGDPPGPEEDLQGDAGFVIRDSVGITIVESRDSLWTETSRWRVDLDPLLEIGSRMGDVPGTAFGRIGPVLRLSEGRIAVADLQALEIRIFSPDGAYEGAWGGPGAGPGELQRLDGLSFMRGDSIVAHNTGFRYEIFGPAGLHGGTIRVEPESGVSGGVALNWFPDGAFVIGEANVSSGGPTDGRQVLEGEWHLFDRNGEHVALLARLPQRWVDYSGTGAPVAVSYGPRAVTASTGDGFWYGFSGRFELLHVGRDGIDRIIRRTWEPEVVPPALRGRYLERFRALAFEELPRPEPGSGDLLVRIRAASVNPLDYKIRDGVVKVLIPYSFPLILGNDLAGPFDAYERFYVARTTRTEVQPVRRDAYVLSQRWWSLDEIAKSSEDVAPRPAWPISDSPGGLSQSSNRLQCVK